MTDIIFETSLEGRFTERGAGEVVIAENWEPWYAPSTYWPGELKRPEWKQETLGTGKGRVHTGEASQKQFTSYALQRAGLTREIGVVPGAWYRFSAWVYVWASQDDNPDVSKGGNLHCRVGANPWGSYAHDYTTVWGKEVEKYNPNEGYNTWVWVSVTFQAWGNKARLFTEALAEVAAKHNDSYWDDLKLERLEFDVVPQPEPQPEPEPGGNTDAISEVLENRTVMYTLAASLGEEIAGLRAQVAAIPKHGDIVTL